MDIQRAFTFVTKDKSWATKLAIGALLGIVSFLILPAFVINGYMLTIARRVAGGDESLPEWEFGSNLRDGFLLTVAQFIYAIPIFILLILGGGFASIINLVGEGSDASIAAGGSSALLFTCVAGLYSLLLLFVMPALVVHYARYGTLSACLKVGEVWDTTRSHLGDIVMIFIGLFALALGFVLISIILNIVPCLGQVASIIISLAFAPYSVMVAGHLFGQLMGKMKLAA